MPCSSTRHTGECGQQEGFESVVNNGAKENNRKQSLLPLSRIIPVPNAEEPLPRAASNVISGETSHPSKRTKYGRRYTKIGKDLRPPEGHRWLVEWDNKGRPIGECGSSLRKRICVIAKMGEIWPLDGSKKKMDETNLVDTWSMLVRDFDLNGHDNAWNYVFEKVGANFRSWKNQVKTRMYEPFSEDEDRTPMWERMRIDGRVDDRQFANLVEQWDTEKDKMLSNIAKKNRRAKKMNHTLGSGPLCQLEYNMRKESERSPTKLEIMERAYSGNPRVENARSFVETERTKQPLRSQEELEEEAVASNYRIGRTDYLFLAGVGAEREQPSKRTLQAKLHHTQATMIKYQDDVKRMEENFQKMHSWLSEVASVYGVPRPTGWNPSFRQPSTHSSHQGNDQRNEEHESDSVTHS